jgi:2-keto-3-deoxy-L-fuconate dehydrogenase
LWRISFAVTESVFAQACAANGNAHFVSLDVTDERKCIGVADTVRNEYGALDILINNVGIGHVGTRDRLYPVNVRGVFNVTKAFIGEMLARGDGVIVNIASIGGVLAIRDRIAYCTTKFALVGLTKSLAVDHATQGVRVNCVCPSGVETPFVKARLREYPDPEAAYREMASAQAIGRMGKPQEIAAAVLYLVSDEAAFVTGSIDHRWWVECRIVLAPCLNELYVTLSRQEMSLKDAQHSGGLSTYQ